MMTGLIHEKEFSRRSFVKGGGALVVGFSVAGAALAGKAAAAVDPLATRHPGRPNEFASYGPSTRPDRLVVHGPPRQHDLGEARQGRARPGLADRALDDRGRGARPRHQPDAHDRRTTPTSRRTAARPSAASRSRAPARPTGPRRRSSAQTLLGLAVDEARRPGRLALDLERASSPAASGEDDAPASCSAASCSAPRSRPTYGLAGGAFTPSEHRASPPARTRRTAPASRRASRASSRPSARTSSSASRARPRSTSRRRCTGTYTYVHNVRVPGMLHGRIVRPRGQGGVDDGVNPAGAVGRPELDRPHPGRAGRADRQLRRRRREGRSTTRSRPRRS